VHVVPNGFITTVSNLTKEWARLHLNVSVTYDSDIGKVRDVINRVGTELAADEAFGPLILEKPHFLRVDAFADSGIEVKILGVTQPIKQWDVMGEFRRRLKEAFDQENIEFAFPHLVIMQKDQ
jgi:small conductance mechanosensitive channel